MLDAQTILAAIRGATSKTPVNDTYLASTLNTSKAKINSLLDDMYLSKCINQSYTTRAGEKQREIWPTGLPYYAPTKPNVKTPPPRRGEISTSILWQHLHPVTQTTEPTMSNQQKSALIVPTNINEPGIKTPQKIVRFLFANTKVTSNEIREHCNLKDIDPFIKAYVRKGYIERTKNEDKLVVYAITPKGRLLGSADALYNQAKLKQPTMIMADNKKPSMDDRIAIGQALDKLIAEENADQINTAKVDGFFDDDGRRYKPLEIQQEPEKIEFKLEQQQHIRFALTDQGTLMILGIQYAPIELSKEDTKRLYDFAENTAHAI